MNNFDSLCDPSAPHTIADADALWRATMDVAMGHTTMEVAMGRVRLVCQACEGGGWECYGLGFGDPHFRVCSECGNPEGLNCP